MIYYTEGNYRFKLTRDTVQGLGVFGYECKTDYLQLFADGKIIIKKGYAWDGCSFPAVNTKKNRRASLVHDSGFQLIRLGLLPASCKNAIDKRFFQILKDDGFKMSSIYYFAVDRFSGFAIKAKSEPKEQTAP